jgi:N-acetylglucosamine-6-phosphate deacetylase
MQQILTARKLYTSDGVVNFPMITVEDGLIAQAVEGPPNDQDEILTAPFFDVHVHGAVSYDFMSASLSDMDSVSCFLATKGVASYLATTVTGDVDATLRSLERLSAYQQRTAPPCGASMIGINLEGPFICPAKRGVHPPNYILAPSVALFDRFQQAAQGRIRLTTIAPEMPGALELIQHATSQGVRVSLGHSNATAAQTEAAIQVGASSATHTFNAMRALDHREPGIAGTVLDRDDLYAEAIVDGVHVHPAIVRLWLKAKGDRRAVLVTDGMAATGMPDGTYKLGDLTVEVNNGVCMSGGVLAGSVLTMDQAVQNLRAMTGASLHTAVGLASHNPARMLGLEHLSHIAPGAAANFNVYDGQGQRLAMILRGKRIAA